MQFNAVVALLARLPAKRQARNQAAITSHAYFAGNRRAGNELALSSRREYLRGLYTSTTTRTWCIRMKR
jgi:hypothetical protein